ncbi:MAG TPA: O-antigen ligase family protein [Solirubrobacteraceae bacterium]
MRTALLSGARTALLAGPTVLAFFSGGYFDGPRAWAGLIAWALVAIALVAAPWRPLGRGGWLAVGGLAALAAWTLLSTTWAPIAGNAYHSGQIVFLYTGALLAAVLLLRSDSPLRAVEPALAAGVLIVIGYGISERLVPGVLQFARSVSAEGRLEQPLTYWNAMGELAAVGCVLVARLAGSGGRPPAMRAAAAAAAAPLGMGLYLSFSRGALFACAAGLISLVVLAPRSEQLRALVVCVTAGVLAAVAAAPFRGVTAIAGSASVREREGAIVLALLVLIAVVAAVVQWRLAGRERSTALALPRRAPWIALALVCAGLALAIVVGSKENSAARLSNGATRLATLQSNRYDYWQVALRVFGNEPFHGVGAGNWSVYWLRERTVKDFAQDAHSLPLQTLAELGVVGALLLLAFLAGVALSARDALRTAPAQAAGLIAGFIAYIAHAPLDWDWEMPAVTLVALVLAGAVIALAATAPRRSAAPRA